MVSCMVVFSVFGRGNVNSTHFYPLQMLTLVQSIRRHKVWPSQKGFTVSQHKTWCKDGNDRLPRPNFKKTQLSLIPNFIPPNCVLAIKRLNVLIS